MRAPVELTLELLRSRPLPQPEPGGDKDGRGRVLVVGGSRQGLLARGADPLKAALFGVFTHATAGAHLGERYGGIGYLARELPAEFPRILAEIAST